jgi:hypothetical protein
MPSEGGRTTLTRLLSNRPLKGAALPPAGKDTLMGGLSNRPLKGAMPELTGNKTLTGKLEFTVMVSARSGEAQKQYKIASRKKGLPQENRRNLFPRAAYACGNSILKIPLTSQSAH